MSNLLISIALLAASAPFLFIAFRMNVEIKKYEFENRSDGGAVGFASYSDSVKHKFKHGVQRTLAVIGTALLLLGGFGTILNLMYG